MERQILLLIKLEIIWWLVTGLIIVFALYPIIKAHPVQFPFWKTNIIFIIVFITLARYIFLLKHTFLGYFQWMKVIVIILCVPLFFYLIKQLHAYKDYMDKIGLEEKFNHVSINGQTGIINYIESEIIFFGVGCVLCSIILPFRMLLSFWRTHNRGTV